MHQESPTGICSGQNSLLPYSAKSMQPDNALTTLWF